MRSDSTAGITTRPYPRRRVTSATAAHNLARSPARGWVMTFRQTVRSATAPMRLAAAGMPIVYQETPSPQRALARATILGANSTPWTVSKRLPKRAMKVPTPQPRSASTAPRLGIRASATKRATVSALSSRVMSQVWSANSSASLSQSARFMAAWLARFRRWEQTMKLEGLRVLDLSQFLPGPHLTMTMADHGADVIMVEPANGTGEPGGEWCGAETRTGRGEPVRAMGTRSPDGTTVWFRNIARGKRAVALDLK